MADEHIDIERVPEEESNTEHKFIYGDIEGTIFGSEYEDCLEGAKKILKAEKDIEANKSDISIPDFE